MPAYDFECRKCDEQIEINLPIDYDGDVKCGLCGNVLFKVFSANPIHFKGSGWAGKSAI